MTRTWHGWLSAITFAALTAGALYPDGTLFAQGSAAPPSPITIDTAAADSIVAAGYARDSIASITAGIVAGNRLVWTHSYGYADMAAHRLATRQTVYRIGSITKPFTAVMLLQLAESGRIRLSDPVEQYLPEVRQVQGLPAGARPITLLQLATMTAGLAREPRQEGPFWTGPVSRWEATLMSALPHTVYEYVPGTKFSYSNIDYAILGAALSRAAGVPYVTWERQHVLAPLGMTRTRFEIDSTIAGDVARGYDIAEDGSVSDTLSAREAQTGRGYKVPNGAIFTTVDDLSRFVAFELGRGPESVLPHARLDSAFGGIVAASPDMQRGYGLGFMVMRRGTFTWMGHSGGVAGFSAMMYYDRPSQIGVILLRNATGGKTRDFAPDILERLTRGTEPHTASETQ